MNAPMTFGRKAGSTPQATTSERPPAATVQDLARFTVVDEAAVETFDACLPDTSPDDELLRGTPAADLIAAMQKLLEGMRSLNGERALAPISFFNRLRGLDIERQLDFEIGAAEVDILTDQTTQVLRSAEASATRIRIDRQRLAHANTLMAELAAATTRLLATAEGDAYHRSRLERRLVDLEAGLAANRLTLQQYEFAERHLEAQCDKMRSVEALLLPLWKQHLFAALHGGGANGLAEARAIEDVRKTIVAALARDEGK